MTNWQIDRYDTRARATHPHQTLLLFDGNELDPLLGSVRTKSMCVPNADIVLFSITVKALAKF